MTFEHPHWERISITHDNGVTEMQFHTNGGSFVWDAQAHTELTEAFDWVGKNHATKVLILTGTGEAYCTELDVTSFTRHSWDYIWWEGRRMLRNLNDVEIPIIGAVNGPALIHSEIPVMGDIVLAAEHAEFADKAHFPLRDTIPGDGVNLVWGELLGPTRVKYWLLTGSVIGAEEGKQIGFINEVLPAEKLMDRAWEIARDLARRDVAMLRYAKAAASIGFRRNFNEGLSHGLGVEGSGHWYMGGLKAGQLSGHETPRP
nr:enoyl-CoA hydratase/isomerase family protein [Arthrobacter sp. efr-133-TYG-118]